MKPFLLSILVISFLAILQTCFAQKYEYDIAGVHFSDSLLKKQNNNIEFIVEDKIEYVFEKTASNSNRKVNFEDISLDSNYIYHKVGEGENIEYILNLYQICATCFAEWNNFELKYSTYPFAIHKGEQERKAKIVPIASKKMMFEYLKVFDIYTGEYFKVALKKNYQNGMSATYKTRNIYLDFEKRTYIKDIIQLFDASLQEIRLWNELSETAYYVENSRLMVGKIEYKYACPCLEN